MRNHKPPLPNPKAPPKPQTRWSGGLWTPLNDTPKTSNTQNNAEAQDHSLYQSPIHCSAAKTAAQRPHCNLFTFLE